MLQKQSVKAKKIRSKYRLQISLLRHRWMRVLRKDYPSKKNVNMFKEDIEVYLYGSQ